MPQPGFDSLASQAQVACALLSIKALHMLGLRATDAARPAEICSLAGLPGGTVRPKLAALVRDRCAQRSANGLYSIPVSLFHRAFALLRNGR